MKILVVGDACIDVFIYGNCSRLAPEAPVPVLDVENIKENIGMAGNVYENLNSLGADATLICNDNWEDIRKTRYVDSASNHIFIRVDSNNSSTTKLKILDLPNLGDYSAIIISDYCKGFLDKHIIEYISKNHDLVFLDTKRKLGKWCENVNFVKINGWEYNNSKDSLYKKIESKLIITLGKDGCRYNNKNYSVDFVPVKDVSGAGDTFLSALVYKYVETNSIDASLKFANECSTIVVQKRGVSTIND